MKKDWNERKIAIRDEYKEYMPTKRIKTNERMRVDVCGVSIDKLPNEEAIDRFFVYWTTSFNEQLIDEHMKSEDAHNPHALTFVNKTFTYNDGTIVNPKSLWLKGRNTGIPSWACHAMIAYCEQEEE
jgi:hypothetical protein